MFSRVHKSSSGDAKPWANMHIPNLLKMESSNFIPSGYTDDLLRMSNSECWRYWTSCYTLLLFLITIEL